MIARLALIVALVSLAACDGGGVRYAPAGEPATPSCACEAPAPVEPLDVRLYPRTADAPALPGELGAAVAMCDPGDVAITGGCRWGKSPGTVDPVEAGPALDAAGTPIGWRCEGLARSDAGNHAPTYATAVCAVAP